MPAQDDRQMLDELAERLGLEDDDREKFISSSMKRLGYKPRVDWDDPDPEGDGGKDDGDFFSRKRNERQSRDVSGRQRPGDQQQRQRSSGGGSFYE